MMLAVTRVSEYLKTLGGWKRNAVAFFLGMLATLTLAPFFIFPLIIPAFTGLFLLINDAPTNRRVFWDGWWWGWGFYITGLYWFCIALLTDAEHFAWLIPFALFGVTGVIAIYCGVACLITSWLSVKGLTKIFVFSFVWMCIEYTRGYLFSGFPWNLEGYSFGFSDASLQLASLVGVYGLTFLAVLLGASFAALTEKCGAIFVVTLWGIFALSVGWGMWRLHEADLIPESERTVPGVNLRLVQANIAQPHKWDPKLRLQGVKEYVRLTESPGLEKITHVIWPETAVPYAIETGSYLAQDLGVSIPQKTILITGALRMQNKENNFQIWNSLVAINHSGNILGNYDKSRLVPFGEFLPLRSLIPKVWLTPVGDTDFSRGPGAETIEFPGLPPISPLICYEVIFPESVVDPKYRPDLLLNVTNDAWFGMSSGPYQHFHMARMRAVEQGIPLVRAANTGISAVIDSYGRSVALLPLGTQGILDSKLPKAQKNYTIYSKYNKIIIQSLLLAALLLTLMQRKRKKN